MTIVEGGLALERGRGRERGERDVEHVGMVVDDVRRVLRVRTGGGRRRRWPIAIRCAHAVTRLYEYAAKWEDEQRSACRVQETASVHRELLVECTITNGR